MKWKHDTEQIFVNTRVFFKTENEIVKLVSMILNIATKSPLRCLKGEMCPGVGSIEAW